MDGWPVTRAVLAVVADQCEAGVLKLTLSRRHGR